MNSLERKASLSLAAVFACRMLGLFMVLPVLALYAGELSGSTPVLIGLAIGAYGLTQALLQIPFGLLSDRIGRRPVIIAGLLLFGAGSLVAAAATSIEGVIAGRLLQGAGAVASTLLALLSDLTSETRRARAMAAVGGSIGLSFILAMMLGPFVAARWGLSGLFFSNALLAGLALAIVLLLVPKAKAQPHRDSSPALSQFARVLRHPQLLRLDLGVFVLHFVLMGLFIELPLTLVRLEIPVADHAWIYLLTLVGSFFAMVPFIILAEKKRHMKAVFCGAITLLGLVFAAMSQLPSTPSLGLLLLLVFLFFMAFNLLEATLPSLVSKIAPAGNKGSAMGAYSSSQFLGAALGGTLCGLAWQQAQLQGVALLCLALVLLWWLAAVTMRPPRHLSRLLLNLQPQVPVRTDELLQITGVEEALVVESDQLAYLKVDHALLDRTALQRFGAF